MASRSRGMRMSILAVSVSTVFFEEPWRCPPSAPLRQRGGFHVREDFWIIVAARSEDETEIRAGKTAGGRRDQGHSARNTSTLFS